MKKALIIFGTTTGNTEELSQIIQNALESSGVNTEIKNVLDATIKDLTGAHDIVLLGCPAYGDGSIELQEDFEDFYEQLDGIELNGKKIAVFAPGDSSYEYFCGSVDMLEERMEELGGKIAVEGLRIDGDPRGSNEEAVEWARSIAELL